MLSKKIFLKRKGCDKPKHWSVNAVVQSGSSLIVLLKMMFIFFFLPDMPGIALSLEMCNKNLHKMDAKIRKKKPRIWAKMYVILVKFHQIHT